MQVFGSPTQWPHQDLIALSDEFELSMVVGAYCSGVFPMPLHESFFESVMGWWSPLRRGVLELDDLRVSRSMLRSARRYTSTIDQAFQDVLERCADPSRPYGWIDEDIKRIYRQAHDAGVVHSIEVWDAEERLVGGLYGVSLRGLFAGESMFHDPVYGRDASKVALARLVNELRMRRDEATLLDVQWQTPHLASLGVSEISRDEYLARLQEALGGIEMEWPAIRRPGDWHLVRTQ